MSPEMMSAAPGMGPGAFGVILAVIWFFIVMVFFVGYVMMIIALWRGAKAHRSIARSVEDLAQAMKSK